VDKQQTPYLGRKKWSQKGGKIWSNSQGKVPWSNKKFWACWGATQKEKKGSYSATVDRKKTQHVWGADVNSPCFEVGDGLHEKKGEGVKRGSGASMLQHNKVNLYGRGSVVKWKMGPGLQRGSGRKYSSD